MSGSTHHNRNPWLDAWADREHLLDAFEEAWLNGRRPTIAAYLPDGPEREPLLPELIHADLEFRVRAGESVRVETYLSQFPELARTREITLELIRAEHTLRSRLGLRCTLTEYLQRFPDYQDELPALLSPEVETSQSAKEADTLPASLQPEAPGLPAVPRYQLLGELGHGGMGIVYRARQLVLKRMVALKMIRAQAGAGPEELARFRAEAEAGARLQHPHIVQVYEVGEDSDCEGRLRCWMALELVEGGNLAQKLRGEPQAPDEAARLVETLARAVAAAHLAGIVHRDLKPTNVLLTPDGQPKVADFGLAKRLDGSAGHTATGAVLGTPSYMAPEQADGQAGAVGPRSDIYALGVILYEMLTGRPPFKAPSLLETLEQVRFREPVPPRQLQPGVPRDLETICLKCLEKEPRRRYASALDLAEDLRRFRCHEPIEARPVGRLEQTAKWLRRRPVWAALIGVSLVAATSLTGIGISLWRTVQRLDTALQVANAEQERTQESEARNREHLYAADLWRAHQLWKQGEMIGLRKLLDRQGSPAGALPERCGFEWHYFERLAHASDSATVLGHYGAVQALAFAPGGSTLATAGQDGLVNLWDVATHQSRQPIPTDIAPISHLSFCDDGRTLAVRGEDGTVSLLDVTGGAERARLTRGQGLRGRVALSPGGRLLAVALPDPRVEIWNTTTDKLQLQWRGLSENIDMLEFSPDGSLLAEGSREKTIRVWDSSNGTEQFMQSHESSLVALAFSHRGRLLATGEQNGTLRFSSFQPGAPVNTSRHDPGVRHAHTGPIRCLAFTPNDEALITGGDDGTVRLWDCRTHKPLNVFRGHAGVVRAVACAPDGQTFASASDDGSVKFWNAAERPEYEGLQITLRPAGPIAFPSNGRTLAVLCRDDSVRLIDSASGQVCFVLRGHHAALRAMAVGGETVATAGADRTIRVWNAGKGTARRLLSLPDEPVCVSLSRDDQLLAVGLRNGLLQVFDVATGATRLSVQAHPEQVLAVVLSPDGQVLASSGDDGPVRFWDPHTGRRRDVSLVPGNRVRGMVFSNNGRLLATNAEGQRGATVWDVATGKSLAVLTSYGPPSPGLPAFAPDDRSIVVPMSDSFYLFDLRTWAMVRSVSQGQHPEFVTHVAFAPDGRTLASASDTGPMNFWDTTTWRMRSVPGQRPAAVQALVFSPNGRTLTLGCAADPIKGTRNIIPSRPQFGNFQWMIPRDDYLRQWDLASGQEQALLPNQPFLGATCLAAAPDGRTLFAGSNDGTVWRWDTRGPSSQPRCFVSPLARTYGRGIDLVLAGGMTGYPEYFEIVRALAVSPDGQLLATASEDGGLRPNGLCRLPEFGSVQLWDAATGALRRILLRKCRLPACVAFSPDGSVLAANDGNEVQLWDVASGHPVQRLTGHKGLVSCLAFAPDGRQLVTGAEDRQIRLWDLAHDTNQVLAGHGERVTSLSFTPDGRTLASGSWDGTVRLWHTNTARELAVLEAHTGPIHAVAFSPDGAVLASGGESADGSGETFLWRR